jgi:predicted acetyltransferase
MTESAAPAPSLPYPIRPIGPDEFDSYQLVDQHGFNGGPMTEGVRQAVLSRFEFDRSLAAFDGGTPVGITAIYSFRLSVPGSELLPAAGVTWVSVLPTYRRRGVLSSIMRRQLEDIRGRGEPLAVLWASEAPIYSRFGYGSASWQLRLTIRRGEGALAASVVADRGLVLRLADPPAALAELAKVYDTVLAGRPGLFVRNESWWQRTIYDPPEDRNGASPLRCVLAEDDSGPRGYALYSAVELPDGGEPFLPADVLTVRELMAVDPAASAALWTDLLSRDLTSEFRARLRPVDDPLLYQLADPRRARPQPADGLWVRIIDVAGALAGRRYSCPVDAVIEVRDDLLPANAGRWRLTTASGAGDAGAASSGAASSGAASSGAAGAVAASDAGRGLAATCARVSSAADLVLDVTQLGAAYLGGTRLGTLAEAGLVTELRPGAVRQLSAAMSWDPAPWCPTIF